MKKLFVVLLVLAIVVLGTPGILGNMAENAVEENLAWSATSASQGAFAVETESFEGGWFTSTSRHRITWDEEGLGELIAQMGIPPEGMPDLENFPEVVINTRLDHGLIPVGSFAGGNGSLKPGLGLATSTLVFESNGESLTLPGEIESHIGLGGTISSTYEVEESSFDFGDGIVASWQQGIINLDTNPASGEVSFDLRGAGGELETPDIQMTMGAWSIDGNQAPTPFAPVQAGDASMSLSSLSTVDPVTGDTVNIGPITMDANTRVNGEVLDSDVRFEMSMSELPHVGDMQIVFDMGFYGMDGVATASMSESMQVISNQIEAMPPADIWSALEGDVEKLFRRGFSMDIREFDVRFENGGLDGRVAISAPPFADDDFHWTSGVQSMQGEAFFSVPGPLMDFALQASNELNLLIAMGVLKRNDDGDFELDAAYEKGVVTMNGQPMALPLPAPTR